MRASRHSITSATDIVGAVAEYRGHLSFGMEEQSCLRFLKSFVTGLGGVVHRCAATVRSISEHICSIPRGVEA